MDRSLKRLVLILSGVFVAAWVLALVVYVTSKSYKHGSNFEHDPQATIARGSGKKLTLDEVMSGAWRPVTHTMSWVAGPNGEDGLLLEQGAIGKDYLVVEDVRSKDPEAGSEAGAASSTTLIKNRWTGA